MPSVEESAAAQAALYLWMVPASAAACALLIVLLRPLMRRYALAMPNARSSHHVPTPQGAGLPVILATVATALALMPPLGAASHGPLLNVFAVVAGVSILALTGAIDDIWNVPIGPRLAIQLFAVAIALLTMDPALRLFPAIPLPIEKAFLALACLWFVNLTNFMDGLDWMTVAEVLPITAGLIVAGFLGALPPYATAFAIGLLGGTLGFAPFNRPVASLFLGDVGSLPIGLLLAWLLIVLAGAGYFAAALLFPLYYLADATITLLRRAWKRERVWEAHRSHFYQRATGRGLSVLRVVTGVFLTNAVLALLALASIVRQQWGADLIALTLGSAAVAGLLCWLARGRP